MNGVMNKTGMREVIGRYYFATNLVHDRIQIGNTIMQLKGYWQFIQRLRNDIGLGHKSDGTFDASDQWWENNTKVIAKLLVCCLCLVRSTLAHKDKFYRATQTGRNASVGGQVTSMNWTKWLHLICS